MRQETDGIIWNQSWKILTAWNEGSLPRQRTKHSAFFRGNYTTDSSFNLLFIRLAVHSGPTTPLNSSASFPFLHSILAASLNFPTCDAYGPTQAQHHYSYWLTTPVIYQWTVTIYNIPTVPYRLLCLNSPEYEGRKLLWKVVILCQLIQHHIPEDFNLHCYQHEKLKSCFVTKFYLSMYIKPREKSHRWCIRDFEAFPHLPTIILPFHPFRSNINQPKWLVTSKGYHYSQPMNRITTWWKGDVGRMMERVVYLHVGDVESLSTRDFLPRSQKCFCYRYNRLHPMLFSPAWF